MANKITPLGARVLVQRLDELEKSAGGIIIPDAAKEKPQEAKVVSLGTGGLDDDGNKITFSVKKNDTILISKYGGTEVTLKGKEMLIINQSDILAIVG